MLILSLEKYTVNSTVCTIFQVFDKPWIYRSMRCAADLAGKVLGRKIEKMSPGEIFLLSLPLSLGDYVANFKLKSTKDQ